jgi:hypothetical protein
LLLLAVRYGKACGYTVHIIIAATYLAIATASFDCLHIFFFKLFHFFKILVKVGYYQQLPIQPEYSPSQSLDTLKRWHCRFSDLQYSAQPEPPLIFFNAITVNFFILYSLLFVKMLV